MADIQRTTKQLFSGRTRPALEYVQANRYRALFDRPGPAKAQLKNFVVLCKDKYTAERVWKKSAARITVADTKGSDDEPLSFWSTAQQETIRVLSKALVQVEGAYIMISDCLERTTTATRPTPRARTAATYCAASRRSSASSDFPLKTLLQARR
jgi:hypothetical protein